MNCSLHVIGPPLLASSEKRKTCILGKRFLCSFHAMLFSNHVNPQETNIVNVVNQIQLVIFISKIQRKKKKTKRENMNIIHF